MSWPLSHDYNEAIQNPKLVFADPDLKAGQAMVGARGLPLPRSGNFADVYQVRGADGRDWAVKCFTRPVVGLAERYARVSEALTVAKLPFVVGFTFLAEGIRVGGVWRPAVKMEWVEGLLLNQVVRENAGKPAVLAALGQMWVRLCKRLREAKIAHADLQHGNVLLVPGSRPGAYGLKLIDYDGMHVPALANQPSGEVGHPAYQHPARAATRAYSPDLDRFPHLVVVTAIKGLEVAGAALWDRHDTGDNLLFTEGDFKKPAASKLMRELWATESPAVQAMVGRLAIACGKPIPQTPWADEVAPEGDVKPLDNATRHAAADALGVALPVPVALPPEPVHAAAPEVLPLPPDPREVDVELVEKEQPRRARAGYRRPGESPPSNARVLWIAGAAVVLAAGVTLAVALSGGKAPPPDTAQNPDGGTPPKDKDANTPASKDNDPREKQPREKDPKEKEPKEKEPKEKQPKEKPPSPLRHQPPELKPVGKLQARERWTAELGADAPVTRLAAGPDGSLLVVSGFNKMGARCLDAATGEVIPDSANKIVTPGRGAVPLDKGRFAAPPMQGDAAVPVWDPKQKQWDRDLLKPIAGVGRIPGYAFVSRDARYLAFGGLAPMDAPAPFKLKDVTADRVLVELDLVRGHALFTDDSSRVLVADRSGRCRWFKLPSGEEDGEWTCAKQGNFGGGPLALSADGAVVFHEGRFAGRNELCHLLDGRSGEVIRSLPGFFASYHGNPLSADGRLAVMARREGNRPSAIDVIETATGAVVAQMTAPEGKDFLAVELLRDGSAAFAVVGTRTATPAETPQSVVRYDLAAEGSLPPPKNPPVTYPPVPVEPGKLHPRWVASADVGRDAARLLADPESGLVLVGGPVAGHAAIDFQTGAARPGFADLGKAGVADFFALAGGRVGVIDPRADEVRLWDARTGRDAGAIDVPEIPPGAGHAKSLRAELSPDGKYLAVGRAGVPVADNPEVPLRVFDAAAKKELLATTWRGGSLHFTADSSRLLVAEWPGRCRWFKLPSGEEDGGWDFGAPPAGQRHLVYGISADGSVLAYKGPAGLKTGESVPGLASGKTGEVSRRFAKHFFASEVCVSADGRRAALLLDVEKEACAFDVVDAATGNSLGTARLPTGRAVPSFALSPDGAALLVHDPALNKLHRLDVVAPKSP